MASTGRRRTEEPEAAPAGGDDPSGFVRSMALLWGLEPRPARGPKPSLTIEGIVATAVELADRDGIEALSMAKLAKALGYTTMSLYRYVQSKDELLMLMTDAALGPVPDLSGGSGGWREGLARWARGCRAAFLTHPWVLDVPITGPPIAPNSLSWLDAGLSALADTHVHEQEKANIVLLLSGFVRNEATLARSLIENTDVQLAPSDGPRPTYGDLLRLVVTADDDRFPGLARAIASGAFDDGEDYGDEEFEFGLARLLDGVAALVEKRRPARRRGAKA